MSIAVNAAGRVAAAHAANSAVKAHHSSNNNVMVSHTAADIASDTRIRVKINGTDYWLLATSASTGLG